jgi:hypothetical protein
MGGIRMIEQSIHPEQNNVIHLIEHYLGLESMEVTEELLDLCGANIDTHALPLLRRRLQEAAAQIPHCEAHGYIRMREKCEQLVASLSPLIDALEQEEQV